MSDFKQRFSNKHEQTTVFVMLPASLTRKMEYHDVCEMLGFPSSSSHSDYDCQPYHTRMYMQEGRFKTVCKYRHGQC